MRTTKSTTSPKGTGLSRSRIVKLSFLLAVMTGVWFGARVYFSPNAPAGVGYWIIDSCLDTDGCWDYVDETCRKDEPDANVLCNRDKTCEDQGGCWDYVDKFCRKDETSAKQLCARRRAS